MFNCLIIAHQRIDSFSIQKLKVSYDDSTQARIDGIEADIIEFHDKLIYCCTCLSERIQNLYKGFTISYSDIQTSGIWLQISLKTPDNVDDTVYGIDQLRRGDNLSLSEFTLNFREKFLKLNSNNNNNNSTASSSNSIIGKLIIQQQQHTQATTLIMLFLIYFRCFY